MEPPISDTPDAARRRSGGGGRLLGAEAVFVFVGWMELMPYARNPADDSRIYFEDDGGSGTPVVFHGGFGEPIDLVRDSQLAGSAPADEFRHIVPIRRCEASERPAPATSQR